MILHCIGLSLVLWTSCDAFLPQPSHLSLSFKSSIPSSKISTRQAANDNSVSSTFAESSLPLETPTSSPYTATYNETIEFPSYKDLMQLSVGDSVTSQTFTITASLSDGTQQEHDFCVKLYPKGGGHNSQHSVMQSNGDKPKKEETGFGMSYAVNSLFDNGPKDERVGAYLQYLPRSPLDSVDASFGLRLKGQQRTGRRFDVEWSAGIRFVSLEKSKLNDGMANDFGAHLLQTSLLSLMQGVIEDETLTAQENRILNDANSAKPILMQVEIVLHEPFNAETYASVVRSNSSSVTSSEQDQEGVISGGFGLLPMSDLRDDAKRIADSDGSTETGTNEPLRVGRIVTPVLRKLSQRPGMFENGVYPGVEYRILRILDPVTQQDVFYTQPGAEYELKPIYPLVQQLERPWPVRVQERDIPKLITPSQYNVISAIGSLLAAGSALFTAFCISQAISLYVIPSKSMEPTLQVGDVLLVEKISPRIFRNPKLGEVVLFHPPPQLQELVQRGSGRSVSQRDLFVKRVSARPGDTILVKDKEGNILINGAKEMPEDKRKMCTAEPLRLIERYMEPGREIVVGKNEVGVLGDCGSVSVDSRVWGTLPTNDIVGRPILRLLPLSRFGSIDVPTTITNDWTD